MMLYKPMGWTSENVASDFNLSREDMDELAALSFQRAEAAQKQGLFDQEIVPIEAWSKPDPKSEERVKKLIISRASNFLPDDLREVRGADEIEWDGVLHPQQGYGVY